MSASANQEHERFEAWWSKECTHQFIAGGMKEDAWDIWQAALSAGQATEPVAAHIVQVGEQICHYTTCVRERCRAEERCLDAASLNQPSPLVKAEALALPAVWRVRDTSFVGEPSPWTYREQSARPYCAWTCHEMEPLYTTPLGALDSAFEAEFDLLPEDAKPLCDTFYRGLRKRLGHPVECSGKSSGAATEGGL